MTYRRPIRVEFNHCDPAGIVFYPRFFEMTNSVIENFFREELDFPFTQMAAERTAVPTRKVETEFKAPARLGEMLDWTLDVEALGGSSVTFRIEASGEGIVRLTERLVLVRVGTDLRPTRWPEAVRARLEQHLEHA
jgi:4-hydroxybenzoyl-CoA thioesterase